MFHNETKCRTMMKRKSDINKHEVSLTKPFDLLINLFIFTRK